jgi:hypothetical protein
MDIMRKLTYGAAAIAGPFLAVSIGVAPALAAGPGWTVKPGGAVTASSTKSGELGITDTAKPRSKDPLPTKCYSSLKVKLKSGQGLPGSSIGSVTSASFTDCKWVLGQIMTVKATDVPWQLNVQSYDEVHGTTSGTITGIHITILGPACAAIVDGTGSGKDDGEIDFRYVNKSHELTFPDSGGNLHYYSVNGCSGLVKSGDSANLHATSTVSPAQTITSP